MIKSIDKFDVRYVPSSFYYPYILFSLNPVNQAVYVDNKSLMPLLFPEIQQPKQICCTFGGGYYNADLKPISKDEVVSLIHTNENLIIKTSIDTERGLGVELVDRNNKEAVIKDIKNGTIFNKHKEFVIQQMVPQSKTTARYNPTSLNCMRITTLNLNGKSSICSMALKVGGKDAVVDNIGGGRGGIIIGISSDGILSNSGFYSDGKSDTLHNGTCFANQQIPNFHKVKEIALRLASKLNNVKLVGWDIALTENNEPVLIEANAIWPGITLEQFCSGPLFGDRTREVIDYVKNNPPML